MRVGIINNEAYLNATDFELELFQLKDMAQKREVSLTEIEVIEVLITAVQGYKERAPIQRFTF